MAGRGGQGWLGSAGREEAGEEGDDQPSARAPLAGPGSPPPWTRPDTQGHMSWNHGGTCLSEGQFPGAGGWRGLCDGPWVEAGVGSKLSTRNSAACLP